MCVCVCVCECVCVRVYQSGIILHRNYDGCCNFYIISAKSTYKSLTDTLLYHYNSEMMRMIASVFYHSYTLKYT